MNVGDMASLNNLIHIFNRMHHVCMRHEMERRGLQEISNPAVLFMLRFQSEKGPVSQKEIADRLGVAPPTAAISIKRMQKAGLVTKQSDDQDLRRNQIVLTEKGKKLVDSCTQVGIEINNKMVEGFSMEEQEALKEYLLRMIDNMRQLGGRLPDVHDFHRAAGDCTHHHNRGDQND